MHRTIKIEFPVKTLPGTLQSISALQARIYHWISSVDEKPESSSPVYPVNARYASHKGYTSSDALLMRRELFRVGTCIYISQHLFSRLSLIVVYRIHAMPLKFPLTQEYLAK